MRPHQRDGPGRAQGQRRAGAPQRRYPGHRGPPHRRLALRSPPRGEQRHRAPAGRTLTCPRPPHLPACTDLRKTIWQPKHLTFEQTVTGVYQLFNPSGGADAARYVATTGNIQLLMGEAAAAGVHFRAYGGTWSMSSCAATDGWLLDTSGLNLLFHLRPTSIRTTYGGDRNSLWWRRAAAPSPGSADASCRRASHCRRAGRATDRALPAPSRRGRWVGHPLRRNRRGGARAPYRGLAHTEHLAGACERSGD